MTVPILVKYDVIEFGITLKQMGGTAHAAGDKRISLNDKVVRGMFALFTNTGSFSVRKIVAFGSGFLNEVLESAVGLEEQVMILAAQLRSLFHENKADFRAHLLTDRPIAHEIVFEAIKRAISRRGGVPLMNA